MSSSGDGRVRALWDCSEDEGMFEEEEHFDLAEMLPPEPEWFPTVPVADETVTPEPTAGIPVIAATDPSISSTSVASPELPVTSSESEPETPADPKKAEPTACPGVSIATPPKFKRLRSKTTVDTAVCPPVKPQVQCQFPESHSDSFVTKYFWSKLSTSQKYNYVYEKIRGFYASRVHESTLCDSKLEAYRALGSTKRQVEGRAAYKDLDPDLKEQVWKAWIRLTEPPTHISTHVQEQLKSSGGSRRSTGGGGSTRCNSLLLTWNLVEDFVDLTGVLKTGEPTASCVGEPTASLDEVVERLRRNANVKEAWERIKLHGAFCRVSTAADDAAISLELCPQTYQLQQRIQLHLHCFVRSSNRLDTRKCASMNFAGNVPHMSSSLNGVSLKGSRAVWSGFLYCALPDKVGCIFSDSTRQPFTQFLVNPNWITNMVQGGKLTVERARSYLVRCVNSDKHIMQLERYEAELERQAVAEAAAEAQRLLGGSLKEQKTYPKVTAFLNQFKKPRHRYKFLVLAGPSKMGKTAFARSLCEPGMEMLELNCASGAEPDLKAYRFRKHGLVLFDEIEAEQVAAQRKLFQAQATPVQLACSSTNCFSYEVFVWRKKLVLASNNWHSSMARLAEADREWIVANSILVDVNEPMWKE